MPSSNRTMERLNPRRPWKKTELVNNIEPWVYLIICCLVLSGHAENRERTLAEHVVKDVSYFMAGTSTDFVRDNIVIVLILEVVFQLSPEETSAVANENRRFLGKQ